MNKKQIYALAFVFILFIAVFITGNQLGFWSVIIDGNECDAVFECSAEDICCELYSSADSCSEINYNDKLVACVQREVQVGRGYEEATFTQNVRLYSWTSDYTTNTIDNDNPDTEDVSIYFKLEGDD